MMSKLYRFESNRDKPKKDKQVGREHGISFKPQPETEPGDLGDSGKAFCATWDKVDRCHTGLML